MRKAPPTYWVTYRAAPPVPIGVVTVPCETRPSQMNVYSVAGSSGLRSENGYQNTDTWPTTVSWLPAAELEFAIE